MKRTLRRFAVYVLAAIMLFPCIPVSAGTIKNVVWKTEMGTVVLSDTPTGPHSAISSELENNVKVMFDSTADYSSLFIVPVKDGVPEELSAENAVLVMQQPVNNKTAEFDFYIKPNTPDGVYALYVGGTDAQDKAGYFEISDTSVMWETDMGGVALGDNPTDSIGGVNPNKSNTVKLSFGNRSVEYATLIIVPVVNGVPEEITAENTVLAMQQPVVDGTAVFSFYLKPSIKSGIYALYAGGTSSGQIIKYFNVNDKTAPEIKPGQMFYYDDYKDSIELKLEAYSKAGFAEWAANKSDMTVKLTNGDKDTVVSNDDISFNLDAETMVIDTRHYAEVLPGFGESHDGGICQTEVSVSTPGYWGDSLIGGERTEYISLIIPDFSAAGFARGVDFDLSVYSEESLSGACPIVSLYDGDILIGCVTGEEISLSPGEEKNVKLTLKCEDFVPNDKLSVRIMLWDGTAIRPLTSYVSFQ